MPKITTHGGARKNAGRPRKGEDERLVTMSVSLRPEQLDAIDQQAARTGHGRSHIVRGLIDRMIKGLRRCAY